jgi:hypothetical protein
MNYPVLLDPEVLGVVDTAFTVGVGPVGDATFVDITIMTDVATGGPADAVALLPEPALFVEFGQQPSVPQQYVFAGQ